MEQIGKIKIDDTYYKGTDSYSDGDVEDDILAMVQRKPGVVYDAKDPQMQNWPVFYHLSPIRENIVSWLPINRTHKVLEVGSGCGALTGALAEKAGSVTCIELSHKRSMINATRHQDRDNINIILGNFQDIEPHLTEEYDYILLIGVLEYAGSYIDAPNPYETMLRILKGHLSSLGRIVVAIENRLGMKYFAGCKEDHTAGFFSGIENYQGKVPARTFSKGRLDLMCQRAGFRQRSFYYPYPDYKFMSTLYSDERLPSKGELSDNIRNFDHDRLFLFDEKDAFDGMIEDGLFPMFANSFLLVMGPPLPIIYAKCSNNRSPRFAIRTEIRRKKDGFSGSALAALQKAKSSQAEDGFSEGSLEVRKIPMNERALTHVTDMLETCKKLEETYKNTGLNIVKCSLDEDEAVFPYIKGKTLEEVLDRCLEQGQEETFRRFVEIYCKLLKNTRNSEITNFDFIFSNIIIGEDNKWYLIDYEWKAPHDVTMDDLLARSIFRYALSSPNRQEAALRALAEIFDYGQKDVDELAEREEGFQKYVMGGEPSLAEIRDSLDRAIIPALTLTDTYLKNVERNRIQVYEDFGAGFSEEYSYFVGDFYPERQEVSVDLELRSGLKALRMDPALDYCLLNVSMISVGGLNFTLDSLGKYIETNGQRLGGGLIFFPTRDPNLVINGLDSIMERARRLRDLESEAGEEGSGEAQGSMYLRIDMEMMRISQDMALSPEKPIHNIQDVEEWEREKRKEAEEEDSYDELPLVEETHEEGQGRSILGTLKGIFRR